jgi:hypothetical protein
VYDKSKLRPSKRFPGVWFHTEMRMWRARYKRHGKPVIIGHYASEIEAAAAFNAAVIAHDRGGGFLLSRINFIPEETT